MKFEIEVARRALKLALREGWITNLPEFPRIQHLHVRAGFFDPNDWGRVRQHLRRDFRDAADFAFLSGWRLMEVLSLKGTNVDAGVGMVRLEVGSTKSGAGRVLPFAGYPQLAEVLERRAAVRQQLAKAGVISPYLFCFAAPLRVRGRTYHPAGAPLFKSDSRDLLNALRDEWRTACARAGLPGRMFHDLRRSAARNFERTGIPRSVARKLGGWTDKIYSRYAIGAESELGSAVGQVAEYLARNGWHSGWHSVKSAAKAREISAEGGGSRTLRRTQCPPGRF
jgi:integrase